MHPEFSAEHFFFLARHASHACFACRRCPRWHEALEEQPWLGSSTGQVYERVSSYPIPMKDITYGSSSRTRDSTMVPEDNMSMGHKMWNAQNCNISFFLISSYLMKTLFFDHGTLLVRVGNAAGLRHCTYHLSEVSILRHIYNLPFSALMYVPERTF